MRITRISLLIAFAASSIFAAGCNTSAQGKTGTAQLSAHDKQQMMEASRKAQIDFQSAQINSSNLPPDQKQRLLEQIRSSTAK